MTRLKNLLKLRYALTEVILITIGVSIALIVQNWNERLKEDELEIKMLKELRVAVNDDIKSLNDDIKANEKIRNGIDSLLVMMEKDVAYGPGIDSLIGMSFWTSGFFLPNTHSFETLKSIGFNIIKNDSLRIQISTLYEHAYQFKTGMTEFAKPFWENTIPFGIKNFKQFNLVQMTPHDFEDLKKNREFKTILRSLQYFRRLDRTASRRALKSAEDAAKAIEKYLDDIQ